MYKYLLLFPVLVTLFLQPAWSQEERKSIREGNELYKQRKYTEAEKKYKQSLEKNNASREAAFNIADALYKQKKFADAGNKFKELAALSKDKKQVADAYHNLGNSLLQEKKYEESIDAYRNALKNNPKDADTKYNLAYAQKKLVQQQQQQNKDKDKKDKKDDQKKDKDKKDKDKDKKDDQKKDKDKDKKEEKEQQANNKMSKEDAKRLLEALNNQEKNVQNKVKKKAAEEMNVNIDKDW
jgi:Ca-activated chloride channel family protein